MRIQNLVYVGLLSTFLISAGSSLATDFTVPPWPLSVVITMYELNKDGSKKTITCYPGDTNYGCTAFCTNYVPNPGESDVCQRAQVYGYPYPTSTINATLETYYLLDVLTAELDPSLYDELPALKAMAIAARTFVGYHISRSSSINNSTQFQVFIPYKFDSQRPYDTPLEQNVTEPCSMLYYLNALNTAQRRACDAVSLKRYVSPSGTDEPARANFFMDVRDHTYSSGDQTYLIQVEEPISTKCDAVTPCNPYDPSCHLFGMSQRGAGRWALGHECSYRGAPTFPTNLPGQEWSVKWVWPEQILFHYYTGVFLRDKDTGAYIGPTERWNPLKISGFPSIFHGGNSYPIDITVQNTSTNDWNCAYPNFNYQLKYKWTKYGYSEFIGSNAVGLCSQGSGSSIVKNISIYVPNWGPGNYYLYFDVFVTSAYNNYWFSDQGWPAYSIRICVDGGCGFLPFIRR